MNIETPPPCGGLGPLTAFATFGITTLIILGTIALAAKEEPPLLACGVGIIFMLAAVTLLTGACV